MSDNIVKMDYNEHERTYSGFVRLSKFTGAALIIVLVLMAVFLL